MEYGNSNNGQHRYRHRGGNQVGEAGNRHQKRSIMTLAKARAGRNRLKISRQLKPLSMFRIHD